MADAIVINKADNENKKAAKLAKVAFNRALHLYPIKESEWQPKVTTCSAFYNKGMDEIWQIILDYIKVTKQNNYFEKNRAKQNEFWLYETINQNLKDHFYQNPIIKKELESELPKISKSEQTPFELAEKLVQLYFKS